MRACMYGLWSVEAAVLDSCFYKAPAVHVCIYGPWTTKKNSTHRENKSAIQMICAAVHLAAANRLKHLFVF